MAAIAAGRPVSAPEGDAWSIGSIYTLAFLTVIYAFNTADRNVFGLLMPLMKGELHVSDTTLGILSGLAFSAFYAFAGVPVAYLSDRWNRRNIIAIGFAVWSLMTLLTGFVKTAMQLAFTRFLLGAGEAGGLAPSTSIVGDLFDKRRRTIALSVMQSANSLGILTAFPVIGWIAAHHGWRTAFIAAGLPGFALAFLFLLTVREPRRGRFDEPGAAAPAKGHYGFVTVIRRLLSSRTYVRTMIASGLVGVGLSGVQTWLPTFLMRVHHLQAQEVGLYIGAIRGPAGIVGAIAGGLITHFMSRRDDRWLVWAPGGFMLLIAASDLLLLLSPQLVLWQVGMGLDTFFAAAQVGPVFALLLTGADARSRAMAVALTMLVLNLVGLTGGPLLVGAMNDLLNPALGEVAVRYSMLTAAGASVLAGLVCLSIGRADSGKLVRPA